MSASEESSEHNSPQKFVESALDAVGSVSKGHMDENDNLLKEDTGAEIKNQISGISTAAYLFGAKKKQTGMTENLIEEYKFKAIQKLRDMYGDPDSEKLIKYEITEGNVSEDFTDVAEKIWGSDEQGTE